MHGSRRRSVPAAVTEGASTRDVHSGIRPPLIPAVLALLLSLAATAGPAPAAAKPAQVSVGEGVRARIPEGHSIAVDFVPLRGEGWRAIARRLCDPSISWEGLRDRSGGGADPKRDGRYQIEFAALSEEWKARVIRALFPKDGFDGTDWVHRPGEAAVETYGEGLWQVAEWLTGDGSNFTRIVRSSGSIDPAVAPGETLRIGGWLLRPGLLATAGPALRAEIDRAGREWERRAAASPTPVTTIGGPPLPAPGSGSGQAEGSMPPAETPGGTGTAAPAPVDAVAGAPLSGTNGDLTYGEDEKGPYALYRLKAGEALYSAVVIRYTGRIDPDEVSQVADEIARASGIKDVTDIAIGHPVRIALDLLVPEFLPPGDPRRAEYDRALAEAARYQNSERASNLEGIHIILDAGHGGVDPGTVHNGVNEHEYVYDVMCRLKRALEKETSAVVHPLIVDRTTGFAPRDLRSLPADGHEKILTHPAHTNGDKSQTTLGVNLRWYLANSIYRKALKDGVSPESVVFISMHADSLHPSLRGGMVYIPGERYGRGTFGFSSSSYTRFREVRERPRVSFTRSERLRSEGLSREFAGKIIESYRRGDLAVHPDQPVRERIIRRKKAWVPAVLRANEVPVKVLLEIANLNNSEDSALIKDPAFRERTARAVMDALLRYYGKS